MKILIVILCIIGYMTIGFGLSITFARNFTLDEKDEALFLFFWPVLLISAAGEIALEWLTKMAKNLSEKLPK